MEKYDVVVLAAGYGTRLERDINQDTSKKYEHLRGLPKPLIPVGGRPLLDRWLDSFVSVGVPASHVHIVTNAKFYHLFVEWAKRVGVPHENIINDGTTCNDDRLGAVADLNLVVDKNGLMSERDLIVVAGDTLFQEGFNVEQFVRQGLEGKPEGANLVSFYLLSDHEEVSKRGIIEVDNNGKVINFLEKPKPEQTTSDRAVPPLYLFSRKDRSLLDQFVTKDTSNRNERDAPGQFIAWLYSRSNVYASQIPGRFDIGGLADYAEADAYFTNK
eukprot:TRINITY_DN1429_c0_g1_i1.p1 TRINITY_DN1429_c0_g1~~TRINITY_DN1429_c0_g1_i1.p1  ORF type:complete len:272 (+),score=57.55 TRINITY_DN1429_c0_g1_i1:127-942(+)